MQLLHFLLTKYCCQVANFSIWDLIELLNIRELFSVVSKVFRRYEEHLKSQWINTIKTLLFVELIFEEAFLALA